MCYDWKSDYSRLFAENDFDPTDICTVNNRYVYLPSLPFRYLMNVKESIDFSLEEMEHFSGLEPFDFDSLYPFNRYFDQLQSFLVSDDFDFDVSGFTSLDNGDLVNIDLRIYISNKLTSNTSNSEDINDILLKLNRIQRIGTILILLGLISIPFLAIKINRLIETSFETGSTCKTDVSITPNGSLHVRTTAVTTTKRKKRRFYKFSDMPYSFRKYYSSLARRVSIFGKPKRSPPS